MTSLREAAQQALEALEQDNPAGRTATITALRAALAEPVQEPEALKDPAEYDDFAAAIRHNERITTWRYDSVGTVALETVYETIIHWDEGGGKRSRRELARRIVDLYTHPPQRKPLTEERNFCPRCGKRTNDIHTCTPPLTEQGCDHCNHPLYAAIKCKNCGRVTE